MVAQHYRWDFVGLSTDTKPTPATSEKVVDGSTFYCSDTSKLYVFCKDTWYERKALGSGGGGTTYTAGDGIDITNNTISVDTTTIQPKLTAGSNVSISDNTISATDTTYSNFTGTDGTAAGTAGLVPAPATTDAGKFLKADGTWDTTGGGGGPTVVQTTGNSTTDVMSQNATTSMLFADPGSDTQIKIGYNATAPGTNGIAIGKSAYNSAETTSNISIGTGAYASGYSTYDCIAIGRQANSQANGSISLGRSASTNSTSNTYSVALGSYAKNSRAGEVNISTGGNNLGYNSTDYRVIGGVHDGQLANDAVTVGQINAVIDAINTALSTNIPHIGTAS